jgi:hypothetical protein
MLKHKCPHCDRIFSDMGLRPHIWRAHGLGKEFTPVQPNTGKPSPVKGRTKETHSYLVIAAEKIKQGYLNGTTKKREFSENDREILSQRAKDRKLGGYRPHPNKGLWYKEIWFDSKWEVEVAKSLDDNSIKWERPHIGFKWTDEGRKYYPDFYLPDFDVYLDPKNSYLRIKDQKKISEACRRNSINVLVLNESQLNWDEIKTLL